MGSLSTCVVFTVILTVITNIWYWETMMFLFWSAFHAFKRKSVSMLNGRCLLLTDEEFFFPLFCGRIFLHEIRKWGKMQKFKRNKTRIFSWKLSESITAAFELHYIRVLFCCFLFQDCTKFSLYSIIWFFSCLLCESDGVLFILTFTIWRRVISSDIWK